MKIQTSVGRALPPIVLSLLVGFASYGLFADDEPNAIRSLFRDPTGVISTTGSLSLGNPFNQSLGTNSRSCATCHQVGDGMSVTPPHIQERFNATLGLDPIFRPNDGSNCDNLDVSSLSARENAFSLLRFKGLIRIGLDVPTNAEFEVVDVDNPYNCSSKTTLSMYRRPLPSTNLRFLTTVMWDGRESFPGNTLVQNLLHQANDATTGHAQGAPISSAVQQQIVDFELGLNTAQVFDHAAGELNDDRASGGPVALSKQFFVVGINDPLNPPFTPEAFDIFKPWLSIPGHDSEDVARRSVARGEQLFNTKPIVITGVAGLNDLPGLGTVHGFCTTCHNTPNVGNHSVPLAINIGISDASRRTPDMPLFTLRNKADHTLIVQTMDPGRAMVTGRWADIGKTKGPILRGLAARAPYFHNGSAATFEDVIDFYVTRFGVSFTPQERADIVNFLRSL